MKSNRDISIVRRRIDEVAPISHELHDYFLESVDIIARLEGFIREDIANEDKTSLEMNKRDADYLLSFLDEEIEIVAKHAKAVYRDVDVTEYDLVGDGTTDNGVAFRRLIDSVQDMGKDTHTGSTNGAASDTTSGSANGAAERSDEYVRILFSPGVYYFTNEIGVATIELRGLERVVFEGRGDVTLLCDGRAGTKENILIAGCRDLEFRNLTIDNSPTPFTLGSIAEIENGTTIVVEIVDGYPEPDESYWTAQYRRGVVRDPHSGLIIRECGDPRVPGLERIDVGRYRLVLDDNSLSGRKDMTREFKTGQLFALHPRQRPDAGNGLSIISSEHLLFSRFDVHSADSHAYGIASSAGVKFLDCAIEPAPGRIIMTNADAFHCRSNHKGIYLERCRVLHMNDDCMNFYSKLASVGEVDGDTGFTILCTVDKNEALSIFRTGDTIVFVNPNTGEYDGLSEIESIETISWKGQKGIMRLVTKTPVQGIVGRIDVGRPEVYGDREYTPSGGDNYRSAMAIDAPFEHMVLNLNAKNDGFIIRNCEMGYNRATGFKCKARNGVIRNTRFHDQHLLFQTEPSWQEGTFPGNIEVTDVIADKGITYQATLPGKTLTGRDAARHMKRIRFSRVRDVRGSLIPCPDEVTEGDVTE